MHHYHTTDEQSSRNSVEILAVLVIDQYFFAEYWS